MGKFADAIRDRRKGGQRRLGFGAASDERQPTMLVGTIGMVEGADFCLALNDADCSAAASSGVAVWGVRLDALTADGVGAAKESGAAFVSFELDGARADAMLDEDVDYVVRLSDLRIEEAEARALGSLRPAELAVEVEFPVGLSTILELRRLALLTSVPLGVKCPADISIGDIEALQDSGVAVFVLDRDVSPDDLAAVKQRIAELPERKPKRNEDAQPLIPTVRPRGDEGTSDD